MTTAVVTEAAESTSNTPDLASDADTVACPDCGQPAVVAWRTTTPSTGLPVEHVKIHCPARHWYFMPAEGLAGATRKAAS